MARPRLGEEYPTVPGYHSARKLIKAMEARGQVVLSTYEHRQYGKPRRDRTVPKLVMLPREHKLSPTNWWHEIDRAQLYVAFAKSGCLTAWHSKWPIDEYRDFAKNHGLNPDCLVELKDNSYRFFLELDRDTEIWSDLQEKIEKFAGLCDSAPQLKLAMVFILKLGYTTDIKAKARKLQDLIKYYGRGKRYFVGPYDLVIKDPTGLVFDCSDSDEPAGLLTWG